MHVCLFVLRVKVCGASACVCVVRGRGCVWLKVKRVCGARSIVQCARPCRVCESVRVCAFVCVCVCVECTSTAFFRVINGLFTYCLNCFHRAHSFYDRPFFKGLPWANLWLELQNCGPELSMRPTSSVPTEVRLFLKNFCPSPP